MDRNLLALTGFDSGGWGGIRTHETREGLPVFKTGVFNRSTTHPFPLRSTAGFESGMACAVLALAKIITLPIVTTHLPFLPSGI